MRVVPVFAAPSWSLLAFWPVFVCFCCSIICADLRSSASAPLNSVSLSPTSAKAHSASRPCRQSSRGGDDRSLVGLHQKGTLHCCCVTSEVFSNACSDSAYVGHHLLYPVLTTMLAKSRSQTEWASPSESRLHRHYVPPPILLCGLSGVKGFDQNWLRQGRR